MDATDDFNRISRRWRKKAIRLLPIIMAVFIVSLPAIYFHSNCDIWPEDDAYITYRYVQNACAGNGLVYNVGEQVFGSSSPLYTAWLYTLKQIIPYTDIPVISIRFNILPFLLCAGMLVMLLYELTNSKFCAGLAGFAFSTNPFMLELSIGGMETFLFLALILAALNAGLRKRFILAYTLVGLSTLARPEGVLCAAVLAILLPWKTASFIRVAVRSAAAYVAVVLLWGIPATLYYGTPIPHSLIAKSAPIYPLPMGTALWEMVRLMGSWVSGEQYLLPDSIRILLGLMMTSTVAYGIITERRSGSPRDSIAILLLTIFFTFYSVTNPIMFTWYRPNIFIPFLVVVTVGLHGLWTYSDKFYNSTPVQKYSRYKAPSLKVAIILCTLMVFIHPVSHWLQIITDPIKEGNSYLNIRSLGRDRQASVARITPYLILGQWMSSHYPDYTVVAAPEIGALGYTWHGRILDTCGLVSPQSIPYLPVASSERLSPFAGAISTKLILELKPDLVVTMQQFSIKSIATSQEFKELYKMVAECSLPYQLWDSHSIEVFERQKMK